MLRLTFTFNEKSDMESMTVSAHYTTGEILEKSRIKYNPWNGNCICCIDLSFHLLSHLLGFIPEA